MNNIIERVKKLLALSKSSNENEANVALTRAIALMKRHNLSETDISLHDMDTCGSEASVPKRPAEYIVALANRIAKAFGVKLVLCTSRTGAEIQFLGVASRAEVAAYSFTVCMRQIKIARKQFVDSCHKNCKPHTKRTRADSYCLGWSIAATRNLPVFELEDDERTLLDTYYSREVTNPTAASVREADTDKNAKHFSKGLDDGCGFNVNKPVHGQSKQKLLS